jgi:hypothetical protein
MGRSYLGLVRASVHSSSVHFVLYSYHHRRDDVVDEGDDDGRNLQLPQHAHIGPPLAAAAPTASPNAIVSSSATTSPSQQKQALSVAILRRLDDASTSAFQLAKAEKTAIIASDLQSLNELASELQSRIRQVLQLVRLAPAAPGTEPATGLLIGDEGVVDEAGISLEPVVNPASSDASTTPTSTSSRRMFIKRRRFVLDDLV